MVDDVEAAVQSIWAETLKTDGFGHHEHFLDLGGHSLAAMRIVAVTRRRFGVAVPVRVLFEYPTVAGFASEVRQLLAAVPSKAASG